MIYDYVCKECGLEKEVWHSINETPEVKCEECGSIMKIRITGGAGVHYHTYGFTRSGSKDGTQGKGQKISETKVAVPVGADSIVSNDVKKGADKVEIMK